MDSNKAFSILRQYFDRTLSPQGDRRVRQWLLSGNDADEKEVALKRIWNQADEPAGDGEAPQAFDAFLKRRDRYEGSRRRRTRYLKIIRYAAVIAMPILTGVIVWNVSQSYNDGIGRMQVCDVPDGTIRELVLTDGTRVTLNGGSRMIYPEKFGHQDSRNVFVTGEAFFCVSRDTLRPFIVHAENMSIRVLGTRFNVRAYPDERYMATTLLKGSVKLTVDDTTLVLHPNEQALYTRTGRNIRRFAVQAEDYAQWTDGSLRFEQQPLSRIIPVLTHKYGVKFKIDSSINTEDRYTMNFTSQESLGDVLDVMTELKKDMTYKQHNNTIILYKQKRR